MLQTIQIKGARQHNLKNIYLEIPKNKFVVFTGVSGSGKSSLAFDTIYAEGQRRYVESLSAYARQFLGIMDKPDVDSIEGLSPSISIDQKTASHNPRSTVGTITEVYDYFRLLYARIGHPHCPKCGLEIRKLSVDEIVEKMISEMLDEIVTDKVKPHHFTVFSPVVRQKKGEFKDLFDNIISKGYTTVRIDNRVLNPVDDEILLIKTNKHSIEIVIDEITLSHRDTKDLVFMGNLRSRLSNTVEQSTSLSDGLVILRRGKEEHLYSEKFSCPNDNLSLPEIEPRMFSFNSPIGACTTCRGIGMLHRVDSDLILNPNLSVNEGGILPLNRFYFHETWYTRLIKQMAQEEHINLDIPIGKLDKRSIDILLHGTVRTYRVPGTNRFGKETVIFEPFIGLIKELERRYFESTGDAQGMDIQRYMREEICDACHGARLRPEVLSITIDGINITQLCNLSVTALLEKMKTLQPILNDYEKQVSKPILKEIATRLTFLQNVGLSYLTISRTAQTLSGGELQRIRLASQIGTGLTGVLYVLDEPSIGLHPRDVSALISTLHRLTELGNTLVVVEHDRETIESADYLVELGPKAGKEGGYVTFTGTVAESKAASSSSLTGAYLKGKKSIAIHKSKLVSEKGKLILHGAKEHNLKNLTITLPLGNLIAITGVSGSGKSTLISETLYPALHSLLNDSFVDHIGEYKRLEGHQYLDRVYMVDQSPIGRTPRSNPATYTGFFDNIRELYAQTTDAKARGYAKGRFSFNIKGGRCEKCQGAGMIKIEMQFLSDVYVTCDICEGKRYNRETLEVKFKGKTIYDVLKMTVDDAVEFFANHRDIFIKLQFLHNVGLGYIEIGQAAPTFSGGEAQRIKLANELSRRDTGKTLYILDEPTTGLHFFDIEKLLQTLHELVEKGNTVIVIEHNLDVIKNARYIVDLGPDGGDKGGLIVYQGPIEGILKEKASSTGEYLKKIM